MKKLTISLSLALQFLAFSAQAQPNSALRVYCSSKGNFSYRSYVKSSPFLLTTMSGQSSMELETYQIDPNSSERIDEETWYTFISTRDQIGKIKAVLLDRSSFQYPTKIIFSTNPKNETVLYCGSI